MAPKKLTEADKKSILKLYREPEETTSTLADRYGVSNSTISRLLKSTLPEKEYSSLIQQKRSAADKGSATTAPTKKKAGKPDKAASPNSKRQAEAAPTQESAPVEKPAPVLKNKDTATEPSPEAKQEPAKPEKAAPVKRTRRRSKAADQSQESAAQLELPTRDEAPEPEQASPEATPQPQEHLAAAEIDEAVVQDIPPEWDDDSVSTLDDDYDEDDEDEDEDDFEDEGESWDGDDEDAAPHLEKLEIAPLTEADLPSLCYVVVERSSSDLVALPLRTFAHLGEIPEAEGESRTLPVFDNHRVARRFSRRNQRVVKLPDGHLLQTTSPYLMAKGITRLLIDGQVFALEDDNGFEESGDYE
jgi:hypothetical protein